MRQQLAIIFRSPHIGYVVVLFLLVTFICVCHTEVFSGEAAHCFVSNELNVCYHPADESVFYDTPVNEVAYNIQVIHGGSKYYYIWHSEPKDKPPGTQGDSIKTSASAGYSYKLPAGTYRIWGHPTNKNSLLYSGDNMGGGGNPMVVSGLPGDSYFYMFFLGVTDDGRQRDMHAPGWRHYLLQARTKDFISFDIRTTTGWTRFTGTESPSPLIDEQGQIIRSNHATLPDRTQGLIGSISYVDGTYHYFYADYAPDGQTYNLYHRSSQNLSTGLWSKLEVVASNLMVGIVMRFAEAPVSHRWIMLSGCYKRNKQDICLQYSANLAVVGAGGISTLQFATSDTASTYALGFSDGQRRSFGQPYWLTDRWGNLYATNGSERSRSHEFYWTDFSPENCSRRPAPGCPTAGGIVFRSRWID